MILKTLCLVLPITAFFHMPLAFCAQFNFTPRVSANAQYTDNLFLTENNRDDDLLTGVSAGFTAQILGKTSGLDLSFDPGYVWYRDNTQQNTWRLPANLRIWNDFSRHTRFEFINAFLRTEDPEGNVGVRSEDDQEIVPGDTTVRRGREPYYTNTAIARLNHQFGRENTTYAEFLYSFLRNDDSDIEDNERYSPRAGVNYWFTNDWGFSLDGVYTRAEFDSTPDYDDLLGTFALRRRVTRHFEIYGQYAQVYRDNDPPLPDYLIYAPSAGFSYDFQRDLSLTLGLGYFYQDIDDPDIDDEEGPFIEGLLSKTWDYQRWNVRLEGEAGLDRNDFGAERIGFEYFARILSTGRYNFTRKFFGNATVSYRYSDLINRGDRQDKRFRGGAGLGYNPTLWMSLLLDYTFNLFNSTDSSVADFTENRVTLRLVLRPDRPWRY